MSTNTAAGKTIHNDKVKNLVITAFFTAITFLGIQSFRIPLPAAVGTPFLHFGHIFVVMGLLLQGGKRGAVSGTLGLTIFDMFTKERLHRLNVQSATHRLISSKNRQVKENGLQSTL